MCLALMSIKQRFACSHVLSFDLLTGAFLKSERRVGMSQRVDRPSTAAAIFLYASQIQEVSPAPEDFLQIDLESGPGDRDGR